MSPHSLPDSFGHSLLEVLVALLVLSAGVIGAAALQLSAWQMAHQSSLHTLAQQLATEMSEWLQVVDEAALGELESLTAGGSTYQATHCYGRHCDTDALLQFIRGEWIQRVRIELPDMQLKICRDTNPWDGGVQAYRWECASSEKAPWVIKMGWFDKSRLTKQDTPFVVMSAAR